jgi:hypothetical protein
LQEERKITEIKTNEKTTYFEARLKYRTLIAPTFSKSYAEKVATPKKMTSIATQTASSPTAYSSQANEKKTAGQKVTNKIISDVPPMEVEIVSGGNSPKKSQPPKSGSLVKSQATQREKTPSPGPSSKAPPPCMEEMEEDFQVDEEQLKTFRQKRKSREKAKLKR